MYLVIVILVFIGLFLFFSLLVIKHFNLSLQKNVFACWTLGEVFFLSVVFFSY